jgi:hypothetical protein
LTDSFATSLGVTAGRGVGRLSTATVVIGGAVGILVVVATVAGW